MTAVPTEGPQKTVLVVEDEALVRGLVGRLLSGSGYRVVEAEDAISGAELIGSAKPDLIILDVGLPGMSGLELLEHIRRTSDLPVIVLSGRGLEDDRVRGLQQGADDYVVKPFLHGELVARVESVLRRSRATGTTPDTVLRFPPLEIDLVAREVRVDGRLIDLTAREFVLLEFLARSPRQVFDRDQLLRQVWGSSSDWQDPATVTEHVRRVRQKVEPEPDHPRWIVTVRGMGYRFEP